MKVWNRIKIKEILFCDVLELALPLTQCMAPLYIFWYQIQFQTKRQGNSPDFTLCKEKVQKIWNWQIFTAGLYYLEDILIGFSEIDYWITREHEWERKIERKGERDTCISNQSMENYLHSIYPYISSNVLIYILFQQILEPEVVGHYDAIVVHADNGAVDFFQKFGFSDDIVLNSRWR